MSLIKCSDRLPKHGEIVLCYTMFHGYQLMKYEEVNITRSRWRNVLNDPVSFDYVTYWMELPEAPKVSEATYSIGGPLNAEQQNALEVLNKIWETEFGMEKHERENEG